ncbi:MAG: MBL fold metallo-hydrolase [Bacteroidetes bacterium]|nr:MBL fold metallo-hydrolase [Bacteroidota bacterium]
MIKIKSFTFNPFYENMYVLFDETGECVIIDPGCSSERERSALAAWIESEKLTPVKLLNTHCHIDHILGNAFVMDKYQIKLYTNEAEIENLRSADIYASTYGMPTPKSPMPDIFIGDGDEITFGNSTLKVLFVPGHSAGHIAFYNSEQNFVINGDVLFHESIGRTDLPGGDFNTLMHSIQTHLLTLPDATMVYCGHGSETNIGHERLHNPYINMQHS